MNTSSSMKWSDFLVVDISVYIILIRRVSLAYAENQTTYITMATHKANTKLDVSLFIHKKRVGRYTDVIRPGIFSGNLKYKDPSKTPAKQLEQNALSMM